MELASRGSIFRLTTGFLVKASQLKMVISTMDAVDEGIPKN